MFMLSVEEVKDQSTTVFEWVQLIGLPIILSIIGIIGVKVNNRVKNAEKSAGEAAAFVRPNGTGHLTQTAMIEDVLLHIGEVRGEMKNIHHDLQEHMRQDSHIQEELTKDIREMKISVEESYELLNTVIDARLHAPAAD